LEEVVEGVQVMAKRKCKTYKMTRAGRRCASYGASSSIHKLDALYLEALKMWRNGHGVEAGIGAEVATFIDHHRKRGADEASIVRTVRDTLIPAMKREADALLDEFLG
jgi:hypothetical protein